MSLQHSVGSWPLFSFLIPYTVCMTPWTGDQTIARPLSTHRTAQTRNKGTQTSMPRVGFEPTNPMFEQEKNVHASGGTTTLIVYTIKISFKGRVNVLGQRYQGMYVECLRQTSYKMAPLKRRMKMRE
jgi:hypothetical protein